MERVSVREVTFVHRQAGGQGTADGRAGRLEFSDGVFAIAITLLVVTLYMLAILVGPEA